MKQITITGKSQDEMGRWFVKFFMGDDEDGGFYTMNVAKMVLMGRSGYGVNDDPLDPLEREFCRYLDRAFDDIEIGKEFDSE